MKIYPYRSGHLENLLLQPEQEHLQEWFDGGGGKIYDGTYAFSLIREDGLTLACAGLQEIWKDRACAWALLSDRLGSKGMLMITRAMLREFAITEYARIEAYVDSCFEQGNRWVQRMGFVNETPGGMKQFINGRTHYLYARIR